MKTIFCSDLDNTLIYSYKRDIGSEKVCVELYEGREVSYMTVRSHLLLKKAAEQTYFVPVTTRTKEQYERINLGIGTPDCALVCNGGVLLKNGQEDEDWYRESLELIKGSREELERAESLLEKDEDRSMEVRNIRELFLFTKSSRPEETVRRLEKQLDPKAVSVFRNGVKVYVVPAGLDKGTAVRRLRLRIPAERLLAAGDSEFDLPMLREADGAMAPDTLWEAADLSGRITELPEGRVFSDRMLACVLAVRKRELEEEVAGLWKKMEQLQGTAFYTKTGLPFTYHIKGGELFTSRRERSITRSTFEKAYRKLLWEPEQIHGPKMLNVYGAPYVWAILSTIIEKEVQEEER